MSVAAGKRRRAQARNERLGPKLGRVIKAKTSAAAAGNLFGKVSKTARKSGAK